MSTITVKITLHNGSQETETGFNDVVEATQWVDSYHGMYEAAEISVKA